MRMKIVMCVIAGALLIAAGFAVAAETYRIDPVHTSATFRVLHRGYSYTAGRFNEIAGDIKFDDKDFTKSQIDVSIKTESVGTNFKKRDDHLRSPDFFNSKEFPEIMFKSTSIEKTGEKTGKMMGDLTLLGVTKPVSFDVTFHRMAPNKKGVMIVGFSASGSLKRTEFGMTYGLQGIGDDIAIQLEAEAHHKP